MSAINEEVSSQFPESYRSMWFEITEPAEELVFPLNTWVRTFLESHLSKSFGWFCRNIVASTYLKGGENFILTSSYFFPALRYILRVCSKRNGSKISYVVFHTVCDIDWQYHLHTVLLLVWALHALRYPEFRDIQCVFRGVPFFMRLLFLWFTFQFYFLGFVFGSKSTSFPTGLNKRSIHCDRNIWKARGVLNHRRWLLM